MRIFFVLSAGAGAEKYGFYWMLAALLLVFLILAAVLLAFGINKHKKKRSMELLCAEKAEKAEAEARAASERLAAAVTAAVAACISAEAAEKGEKTPGFRVVAFRRTGGAQPWNRR